MNDSADATTAVPWRRVALIVTTALVVKLIVLVQLWNHPLLQPHGELDTAYYIALGRRIALEGVFAPIGAFFVSPLYVSFLAAVFAIGGSLLATQLIQIGLGAAAVGMLFATARHWFGERAALVAAGLAILTGVFTFNEVLILQSALDPFLVSSALYALTRTLAGGGTWTFAAAGASLGLLALNRPNAIVFAVAAAAGVFVIQWRHTAVHQTGRGRRRWWPRVNHATALTASLLTVLAVNAARNYAVSGDFVLIASHGGLNLYIGNHDCADGTYTPVPGITPSIAGQARDSTRVAESNVGRRLSPGEVSDYFARRAIDWVIEHPADALRLTIRKIGILLNRVDVPLNYSYAFYAREPSSLLRVLAVGPWLLVPFGLVGLLWPTLRANRFGYWVWAMFVPVYGAAVVLFFVTDRYRMPLFVPLCATAGAALLRFFDLARARRFVPLLLPAGAVSVAALVAFANLGLDNGIGSEQTRKAVWLIEQGSFDEARRFVEQIANEHSHPGVLRFRVGQALLDAGRQADAAPLLTEATGHRRPATRHPARAGRSAAEYGTCNRGRGTFASRPRQRVRHQCLRATARACARPIGPDRRRRQAAVRDAGFRCRWSWRGGSRARLRDAGARTQCHPPRRSDGCKWRWRARRIEPRRTRSWAWRFSCRAILNRPFRISSAPGSSIRRAAAPTSISPRCTPNSGGLPRHGPRDRRASPRPRGAACSGPSQSPSRSEFIGPRLHSSQPSKPPLVVEFRCIIAQSLTSWM